MVLIQGFINLSLMLDCGCAFSVLRQARASAVWGESLDLQPTPECRRITAHVQSVAIPWTLNSKPVVLARLFARLLPQANPLKLQLDLFGFRVQDYKRSLGHYTMLYSGILSYLIVQCILFTDIYIYIYIYAYIYMHIYIHI